MTRLYLNLFLFFISACALAQPEISNISAMPFQTNVLRFTVSFTTSEPAMAYVEWYRNLEDESVDSQHSAVQAIGTNHSIEIIGLVSGGDYKFKVHAWNSNGCTVSAENGFTPGALPADVSTITDVYTNTGDLGGYFMTNNVGTTDKTLQLFNRSGEVVWYDWHAGVDNFGGIQNCETWNKTSEGNIITVECHTLQERDLYGNILADVDFNGTYYDTVFFHHDVIKNSLGHYVAVCAELRYFDFTPNGGSDNQAVVGEGLLEFDAQGNVYWYWTSFDYFDPVALNATNQNVFFTPIFGPGVINWQHCNSVHEDYDGDYIVSYKERNQLYKIDHSTGEIIWTISGTDPSIPLQNDGGFGDQHDLNNIDPNRYILFDNTGLGAQSRLVEFTIDYYESPIAYKSWEYVIGDSIASPILGTARRLPNGNRLGVCGAPGQNPANHGHILEVTEDGEVAWHAKQSSWVYRAYFYENLFDNDADLAVNITSEENTYCPGHEPIALEAEPTGGCWSGNGVENGMFNPSLAGEGTHTIYYNYAWLMDSIQVAVEQQPITIEMEQTICFGDSALINGTWQFAPGVYSQTLLTAQGCDSTEVITLVVNPIDISNAQIFICEGDSAFLENAWQTESGFYVDVFNNQFGCDSAVVTSLTVNTLPAQPVIQYVSGGGMDQVLECDVTASFYMWYIDGDLVEGVNGSTLNTGDYDLGESASIQVVAVSSGCASPISDPYFITGIQELNEFFITVVPNPARDVLRLTGNLDSFGVQRVRIYNAGGQLLYDGIDGSWKQGINVSGFVPGIHCIQLSGTGNRSITRTFIVE